MSKKQNFSRLLTSVICLLTLFDRAIADDSFQNFSWIPAEAPPEVIDLSVNAINQCLGDADQVELCAGSTLERCEKPSVQCYYIEAAAWEIIAYDYYQELSSKLNETNYLKDSQHNWIQFARAECAITTLIHRDNDLFRAQESARCALKLTALRAAMLQKHLASFGN